MSPAPLRAALRVSAFPLAWFLCLVPAAFSRQSEPAAPSLSPSTNAPLQGLSEYRFETGLQYRVIAHATNFERHPEGIEGSRDSSSLTNLRLRQWLGIRNNVEDDHGAYLQLEYGHLRFGSEREFTKDEQDLELRRGYLWLRPRSDTLLRLGVLDWQDRFGERPAFTAPYETIDAYDTSRAVLANSVWDFNVGGALLEGRLGERTWYRAGALALGQGDRTVDGAGSTWLLAADVDREVDAHLVGASLYFLRDEGDYSYGTFGGPRADYASSWDLWLGVRAHLDLGGLRPSFFAIWNQGETDAPDWKHEGFALKAAVERDLGEGTLSVQFLGSSGDDGSDPARSKEFRTIAQGERDNFGSQGYWSHLAITSPRGPTDNNDLGVGLQNRGLGLLTLQAAYDRPLSDRVDANLALGWLRSAEENPSSGASDMGVEIAAGIVWRAASSLSVATGAAWLFTGDFYQLPGEGSPEDLHALYLRVQLEF